MGLGKTLTMLSLIAANPFLAENLETDEGIVGQESTRCIKSTLIVVPFSRKN
jgi:SNF2 family DNA or RNA helicase